METAVPAIHMTKMSLIFITFSLTGEGLNLIIKSPKKSLFNGKCRAVDPGTGEYYQLISSNESWKPEEYPFSGYH